MASHPFYVHPWRRPLAQPTLRVVGLEACPSCLLSFECTLHAWTPRCWALPASWAFTCLVLGQFVSSSANPMVALTVLPAFAAPMIMFSGVLYEKSTAPAWLGWLHRVSLVNYAFSALVTEQIHTLPQAMAQILQDFVDLNRNGTGANVLYMGVLILALQGLTYLALSWRVRHSRSAA